jgi:hypothetical protein
MENFEALGRYVTAKEQAEKFLRERASHLAIAKRLIEESTGSISGVTFAYDFDPTAILEAVNKAAEAHQNMIAAVDEANRQADQCAKSKLKIEKPYNWRK